MNSLLHPGRKKERKKPVYLEIHKRITSNKMHMVLTYEHHEIVNKYQSVELIQVLNTCIEVDRYKVTS